MAAAAVAATGLAITGTLVTANPGSAATRHAASPVQAHGFHNAVTFIGDSVTAGFGFCGVAENAPHVSCKPNQEMANAWYFGDNSLSDCAPPDPPKPLTNACSNDNDNGKPWDTGTWTSGLRVPRIAYPYQIAGSQPPTSRALVSDWAITGSAPEDWDPESDGAYADQLKRLKDQYVVMTLGANPLLSYFTDIYSLVGGRRGECVDATFEQIGNFTYSGPISRTLRCAGLAWAHLEQDRHLVDVYKALLQQNDRVIALGYYRVCPWSFGNWQPRINIARGPAKGHSCRAERYQVSPTDRSIMTQWDQSGAVIGWVNDRIQSAVLEAKAWALQHWPGSVDANRFR